MTNIQENISVAQINEQIRLLQMQKNRLVNPNISDVIYQYYTVTAEDQVAGHICVALKRPPKGGSGIQTYKAAFSFCAPSDNYSKKIGRKIATGRLNNERKKLAINFNLDPNLVQVSDEIKIGKFSLSLKNDNESEKERSEKEKAASFYWQLCFARALEWSLTATHEPKKNGFYDKVTFAPDWFKNLPEKGTEIHIGIF